MASAKEIPPGGEGKIDVTFKTGSKGGQRKKTVTVTTNDPKQAIIKLSVAADVRVALALEPERVNFQHVKRGAEATQYVSLTGTDKDTTKILSVESQNKFIKVETNPKGYQQDKDKKIKITILPDMQVGRFRDKVTVHTDHKSLKNLTVSLYGELLGDITVRPRSFSFGFFEKDKIPDRTVTLRANPVTSFKVLQAESIPPDVETEVITIKEGKEYQVKAHVKEGFAKDSLQGRIIITTDNKSQQTIEVRYFGRIKKHPPSTPPMTSRVPDGSG